MTNVSLRSEKASNWFHVFHEVAHYSKGVVLVAPPATGKTWLVNKMIQTYFYFMFDLDAYGVWDFSSIVSPKFNVGLDLWYFNKSHVSVGIDERIVSSFRNKSVVYNQGEFSLTFSQESIDNIIFDFATITPLSEKMEPKKLLMVTYIYDIDSDIMRQLVANNLKSRYTILKPYSIPKMEYHMYPPYATMLDKIIGMYEVLPDFYLTYKDVLRYIFEIH